MDQETIGGANLPMLLASAAGSAISLSYVKELTRAQAVIAFGSGVATAFFCGPALLQYFKWDTSYAGAVSFLLGLGAMRIIPAFLAFVDKIRDIKMPGSQ